MADTVRLIQSGADNAAALSSLAEDTGTSLAAIRAVVDELRAIQVEDPAVQAAIDSAADGLDAGTAKLGEIDAAIRAAGNDPGSPIPPVPEPEPPVEPPQ